MVFLHPVTNKGLEDDPNNALSPSAFFVPLKQAYQFERSLLLQLNGLSEWHFVLLKWSLSLRLNGTLCAVALEENSHSGAQLLARNLGSGIGFVEFWEGSGVAFTDPAVTVDSRAKSLSLCVFFFFTWAFLGPYLEKNPPPGALSAFSRRAGGRRVSAAVPVHVTGACSRGTCPSSDLFSHGPPDFLKSEPSP